MRISDWSSDVCSSDLLATAWHEAGFEPVEEIGKGRGKAYGKPGKYRQSQHGRGLVQVTWDSNYEWLDAAAAEAGLITPGDLLKNFDLALRPDIAALALVKGMEDGAYTGKSLADYLPDELGTMAEFENAGPIINDTDRKSTDGSGAGKGGDKQRRTRG